MKTRAPLDSVELPSSTQDADTIAGWLDDAAHYGGGASSELFFPESEGALAAILLRGVPCLAVGAQSSLTGGATPRSQSLVSLSRMKRLDLAANGEVRVGAGVVLRDMQERLSAEGLYYPPAPTYDGATIGGNVATNAAGAATFAHGTTRDWVQGLTVVLACGEVLELRRGAVTADADRRFSIELLNGQVLSVPVPEVPLVNVAKNSSGYFGEAEMDLVDLFIGSEGTLGVITEVVLRTVSPAPAWFVALVALDGDDEALALTADLREAAAAGRCRVSAIEYMDRACVELIRDAPCVLQVGLARDESAAVYLLVQVELPSDCTAEQARSALAAPSSEDGLSDHAGLGELSSILLKHGVLDRTVAALPGEDAKRRTLFAVREAVPEAVNRSIAEARNSGAVEVSKSSGDFVVPFERFPEALAEYRRLIVAQGLRYAVWGHISDGNVHPNILPRSDGEMALAKNLQLAMGRVAIEFGGAPMAEHGTGRNPVKQQLLREFQGERGMNSMAEVRRVLDPGMILAAGVLWPVGGNER